MRSSHCGYLQYLCLFNAFISDPARSAYKNNTVCTWNCCQFSPLQDGIFSWETKSIENVYKTFLRHSSQNSVNSSSRREQRVYSALWEMISSQVCYCWLCHHLTLAAEQQCHSWDGLNSSRLKWDGVSQWDPCPPHGSVWVNMFRCLHRQTEILDNSRPHYKCQLLIIYLNNSAFLGNTPKSHILRINLYYLTLLANICNEWVAVSSFCFCCNSSHFQLHISFVFCLRGRVYPLDSFCCDFCFINESPH